MIQLSYLGLLFKLSFARESIVDIEVCQSSILFLVLSLSFVILVVVTVRREEEDADTIFVVS